MSKARPGHGLRHHAGARQVADPVRADAGRALPCQGQGATGRGVRGRRGAQRTQRSRVRRRAAGRTRRRARSVPGRVCRSDRAGRAPSCSWSRTRARARAGCSTSSRPRPASMAFHRVRCRLYQSSTPYFPFSMLLGSSLSLSEGDREAGSAAGRRASIAPDLLPWLSLIGTACGLHDRAVGRGAGPGAGVPPGAAGVGGRVPAGDRADRAGRRCASRTRSGWTTPRASSPTPWWPTSTHVPGWCSWPNVPTRGGPTEQHPPAGRAPGAAPAELPPQLAELVAGADRGRPAAASTRSARSWNVRGGNPLFLLELLNAVQAGGDAESLPTSVEGLLTARIDRLAGAERTLLRHLSVLGAGFDPGLRRRRRDRRARAWATTRSPAWRSSSAPTTRGGSGSGTTWSATSPTRDCRSASGASCTSASASRS